MPIITKEKYTQLEFGYGDIEVAPALLDTVDVVGAVCFFRNANQNKIGEYVEYDPHKVVGIEDTPVRMTFERVESIDVVIDALEKAKRMMIEKAGGLNNASIQR